MLAVRTSFPGDSLVRAGHGISLGPWDAIDTFFGRGVTSVELTDVRMMLYELSRVMTYLRLVHGLFCSVIEDTRTSTR